MKNELENLRGKTDQAFLEETAPALKLLEEVRLKKLASYLWRKKAGTVLAIFLTPLCGWIDWLILGMQSGNDDKAAGITFVVLGLLFGWATQPVRQYTKIYKDDILPKIAALFGNLTYSARKKIPMEEMKPSEIVPSHTGYSSEDCFEGSYRGVSISLAEIKLTQKQGKSTRTVFRGLAILISHPKPKFLGHTIVCSNQNVAGKWFLEKTTGLDRADLVDPGFEKIYDVYTSDQVEARYLIDPVMIETFKSLRELFGASALMAAYYKNRSLILVATEKNHFEPPDIQAPATGEEGIMRMKHELEQVLSLIDRLEMHEIGGHDRREAGPPPGRVTSSS